MYWGNFLHLYQPPTQKKNWVNRIAREAYRPIVSGLLERPSVKITFNINGVLLELLQQHGDGDIIKIIGQLLERGQIELTGSAKYHPLLPFLPDHEIKRQIELNEETLRHYFGQHWKKSGFFPPEMGFDLRVAQIVKDMGYQWIIADELSYPGVRESIDYSKRYTISGLGDFGIYFRERKMSWYILSGQIGTGNLMVQSLGSRLTSGEYLLTAMDGETFGHHRPGLEQLLFEISTNEKLETVLISDLAGLFANTRAVEPLPSTWALMEKDLEEKKPFSRWKDPDNEIQGYQWELTQMAIDLIAEADTSDPNFSTARTVVDRALHSDQYWWASARPWWSIEMIERGAKELIGAVTLTPGASEHDRLKAQKLYYAIIETAFNWQRAGIVDERAHKEDEDIRQRTDSSLPHLPASEIDKMTIELTKQLKQVVAAQEFERAAHIRDRIAELNKYKKEQHPFALSAEGDKEW